MGTYLYAIGGNELAAEYSGINVKLIKMIPYLIGGFSRHSAVSSGQPGWVPVPRLLDRILN